jgi:predicted lipoprotein
VATAVRRDPVAAAKQHAHQVGIGGTAYYFVRGRGWIEAVETNRIVVAIDGADGVRVALRVGPLFGNAVRDGIGLLDVNDFPGLQEFNALAAELNRLVETRVFPEWRARAQTGATVEFAGVAEAPESVEPGPVLSLVPLPVAGPK